MEDISNKLRAIDGDRTLSWLERRKAKKELLAKVEPKSEKEKKLLKKLGTGTRASQINKKEYEVKKKKTRSEPSDLSQSEIKRKAITFVERKYVERTDKQLEAIEKDTKLFPEQREAAKKELLLKKSETIKRIDKQSRKVDAEKNAKIEALAQELKKQTEEKQAETMLEAKIKEKLGEAFYAQFLLIKDVRLSELIEKMKTKKETVWDKIKKPFIKQKEEMGGISMEKKLTMQHIFNLYGKVNKVEQYNAYYFMTVKQFLTKYL